MTFIKIDMNLITKCNPRDKCKFPSFSSQQLVKQLQLVNIVFDVFVRCVFFLFSLKIEVEKTQSVIYLRVMIQVFRKRVHCISQQL